MATEELSFDVLIKGDKAVSAGFDQMGKASADAAVKIEAANIRVEKSAKTLAAVEQKYGKESLQARDAANKLAQANMKLADSFDDVETGAEQAEEAVGGIGAAAAAAGAAVVGAGIGAVLNKSLDIEQGRAKLAAQLGATGEDAERYGKIAGDLYSQNFGESMENVNDAVANVTQNIGKLGDDGANSLQNVTANVLSLSDAFGVDLFDVTKAVGTMMRTGLSKDAQSALDTITIGLQKVPGAAEDLLDTFTEYSVQFDALGLSADQALSFIAAAMAGGARNTDLAADALKEFNLRAKDLTNVGAQGALRELGLESEATAKKIAGGGASATAAMAEILTRLREVPDPADKARLATALLGTQAEDLQAALFAVDPAAFGKGLEGTAGSAQKLSDTLGGTNASKIETYRRELESMVLSATELPGPLGLAAGGVAAFGGSALIGASSLAQIGTSLALIPGASAVATAALVKLKLAAIAVAPAFAAVAVAVAADQLGDYVGKAYVADVSTTKLADSLEHLGSTGQIGKTGLDLFTGTGGFGLLHNKADDSAQALERFGNQAERALGDGLEQKAGRALNFGKSVGQLSDTTKQLDGAFTALVQNGKIDEAAAAQAKFIQAAKDAGVPVEKLNGLFPQYAAAVKEAQAEQTAAAAAAQVMGTQIDATGKATAQAAVSQEDLNKAVQTYVSTALEARGSARNFEAAIDAASDAVKTNGRTLDITTEKGRANQEALDGIAEAGLKVAEQVPEGVDAQEHFQSTMKTTRARLEDAAFAMTGSKKKARELTNEILGVPSSKGIKFKDNTGAVKSNVNSTQRLINAMHGKNITNTITTVYKGIYKTGAGPGTSGQGLGVRLAVGGQVRGPGTSTSDDVPAWLSNGEHIISAAEVQRLGGHANIEALRKGMVPTAPVPVAVNSGRGGGGTVVLELRSSGTQMDDMLVEIIRKAVRVRGGGSVQTALGRN